MAFNLLKSKDNKNNKNLKTHGPLVQFMFLFKKNSIIEFYSKHFFKKIDS